MAIELEVKVPIKREERSDQAIISCAPGNYSVLVTRVIRDHFADGTSSEFSRHEIRRTLPELLADPEAAALVGLLPALFDRWAREGAGAP